MLSINSIMDSYQESMYNNKFTFECSDRHSNLYMEDRARDYRSARETERKAKSAYQEAWDYCDSNPEIADFYGGNMTAYHEDVMSDMMCR